MFSWTIIRPETGEILIKEGYAYPHTALASARSFIKHELTYGTSHARETLKVTIRQGNAEAAVHETSVAVRQFETTADEFVKQRGYEK